MKEILLAVLRGAFAYLLLLAVSRVIGRKAIAKMTFFDYAVSISIGSLAAYLGVGASRSTGTTVAVVVTFTALYLATSMLSIRNMGFRSIVDAEPVVVLARGRLLRSGMKKVRLTLPVLLKLLREKDVFNISDVEYAILETNGQLSVLLKSNRQPLTPQDMNVPTPYRGLSFSLIEDGVLLEENLAASGHDAGWLKEELATKGIRNFGEVFYAALDSSGNLYVSLGEEETNPPCR